MKILKILGLLIVVLVALFLITSLILPKKYEVQRSIEIEASPEKIWTALDSWEDWLKWSPWYEMDTTAIHEFGGEEGQEGSWYTWKSDITGVGKMEATKVEAPNKMVFHLSFTEPNESESDGAITVEAGEEGKSTVTWTLEGEMPWYMSIMGLAMDGMIGKDYEKGLNKLKTWVESMPDAPQINAQVMELAGVPFVMIKETTPMNELQGFFSTNAPLLYQHVETEGIHVTGPMYGLYYTWDMENGTTDVAVAAAKVDPNWGAVTDSIEMEMGKAAITENNWVIYTHKGGYSASGMVHMGIEKWAGENGKTLKNPAIERYDVGMMQTPDTAQFVTQIIYQYEDAVNE